MLKHIGNSLLGNKIPSNDITELFRPDLPDVVLRVKDRLSSHHVSYSSTAVTDLPAFGIAPEVLSSGADDGFNEQFYFSKEQWPFGRN
jgi:hypothetical protein